MGKKENLPEEGQKETEVQEAPEAVEEIEGEAEVSEDGQDAAEAEGDVEPEAEEVDELTQAQQEAEAYKDRWMRLAAEFENYKKRKAREFDALVQSASENVIRDLLPILDAVDRALVHSKDGQTDSEGYLEGVKMIMEQLPKVLHNRNLSEIRPVGESFDPNFHEALMQAPSEEHDVGVVMEVVEIGYQLRDKVLRPAKVVVSQGKPEAKPQEKK
ncbi:MAG: nucleotide exchange factor GrpE [bacterium]|nr:nucleotide exchange factor GrpE [bacterium]